MLEMLKRTFSKPWDTGIVEKIRVFSGVFGLIGMGLTVFFMVNGIVQAAYAALSVTLCSLALPILATSCVYTASRYTHGRQNSEILATLPSEGIVVLPLYYPDTIEPLYTVTPPPSPPPPYSVIQHPLLLVGEAPLPPPYGPLSDVATHIDVPSAQPSLTMVALVRNTMTGDHCIV